MNNNLLRHRVESKQNLRSKDFDSKVEWERYTMAVDELHKALYRNDKAMSEKLVKVIVPMIDGMEVNAKEVVNKLAGMTTKYNKPYTQAVKDYVKDNFNDEIEELENKLKDGCTKAKALEYCNQIDALKKAKAKYLKTAERENGEFKQVSENTFRMSLEAAIYNTPMRKYESKLERELAKIERRYSLDKITLEQREKYIKDAVARYDSE